MKLTMQTISHWIGKILIAGVFLVLKHMHQWSLVLLLEL